MDDQYEQEDEDAKLNYGESDGRLNDQDDFAEENAPDPLAATGLEDSDAEEEVRNPYFFI